MSEKPTIHTKPAPFWMVWNKNGHQPMVTHPNEATAKRVAKRMAEKHPGEKFIVLGATEKFWIEAP